MPAETLTTISPSTNQAILTRRAASPEEIAQLPATAHTAFALWRKSHPTLASRQKVVVKALQLLSEQKDDLARELTEQMGRPINYTGVEIATAVKRGEYLNRIAGQVLGHDIPGEEEKGFRRFIRREPVGAVLIIFAWNVRLPTLCTTQPAKHGQWLSIVSISHLGELAAPCSPCRQCRHPQAFSSNTNNR